MSEQEVVDGLVELPKDKLRAVFDTLMNYSHSDDLWGDLEQLLKECR